MMALYLYMVWFVHKRVNSFTGVYSHDAEQQTVCKHQAIHWPLTTQNRLGYKGIERSIQILAGNTDNMYVDPCYIMPLSSNSWGIVQSQGCVISKVIEVVP